MKNYMSLAGVTAVAMTFVAFMAGAPVAYGDGAHSHVHAPVFSAGEPGDPKKSARTVQVVMRESDGRMLFVPDKIDVRKGEQVRFILRNNGALDHEFILATTAENIKHAEAMKKNPEMEHDEPNGRQVKPGGTDELVWRFTKAGEFEFSCLIPGHRETGMTGKVIVR